MSILTEISENLQKGKAKDVKELVQTAIDQGITAKEILNSGLIAGMDVIGTKFRNNEVYVPDVLIAARAMNMGASLLKPLLVAEGVEPIGKLVIGTVKGDLHDIGKNLVKMMMEGKGIEVIDLGVDVDANTFIEKAIENKATIIALSALLTTTMESMKTVVELAKEKGVRDQFTIMIGGAPITQSYCDNIGADIYSPDAGSAADAAQKRITGVS